MRCLAVLVVILPALLSSVAAPCVRAQDQTTQTLSGTVEVDTDGDGKADTDGELSVTDTASGTYSLRLRVRLDRPPESDEEWFVRIWVDGEIRHDGYDLDANGTTDISWTPSVGWDFDGGDFDEMTKSSGDFTRVDGTENPDGSYEWVTGWRGVSIRTNSDVASGDVVFTHDVWDATGECPIKDVGRLTAEVGSGGSGDTGTPRSNLPALEIEDVTVNEGDGNAVFRVTLSESSGDDVTVRFETLDATAHSGRDYEHASGTLTIDAGTQEKSITVRVLDDDVVERDETFIVTLGNPTNATIRDHRGVGTIISDDTAQRTVSFGSDRYSVTEGSAVTVTVKLTPPLDDGSTLAIPLTHPSHGDATPEVDYSGIPDSVTFGDSEASRTFVVLATEDAEDDDGEKVVLEFDHESENWPSGLALANPEVATITINEPRPADEVDNWTRRAVRGWLRRFGDTSVVHVLEALNERMRCAPIRRTGPGGSASSPARRGCEPRMDEPMSFVVAGRRLSVMPAPADASEFLHPADGFDDARALDAWPVDTPGTGDLRSLTAREVLAGSAFHISPGVPGDGAQEEGRRFSFWGRGTLSAFDTEEGGDDIDGDVTSATFGLDFADRRLLAGFAISHSEGDGSFSRGGRVGEAHATLTGVYPYLYYGLNELVSIWGAAGFGSGTLSLRLNGLNSEAKLESKANVASRMGAVGVRRELLYPAENRGVSAALKADALLTQTTSDASRILAGTRATGNRQRIAMEVAQEFTLALGAWVAPYVEVGARRDGGAESGEFGLEVNSGFRYEYPFVGLTAEFGTRGLFGDGVSEFDELGVSGSFRYDPVGDSELGPDFALSIAGGAEGWLDPQAPWGHYTMDDRGLDGGNTPEPRIDAELAYGLPVLGGSDTSTPWLGASMSERWRDLRLGYRREFGSDVSVGVEGRLRQGALGEEPSDYAVMLRLSIR